MRKSLDLSVIAPACAFAIFLVLTALLVVKITMTVLEDEGHDSEMVYILVESDPPLVSDDERDMLCKIIAAHRSPRGALDALRSLREKFGGDTASLHVPILASYQLDDRADHWLAIGAYVITKDSFYSIKAFTLGDQDR